MLHCKVGNDRKPQQAFIMLLRGFFNAQCDSAQHGSCNSLTAMDFTYTTSKMRQSAIIIGVRASLRWCERCCSPPGNICNYIIYVHAIHRKERSQCYNAGSLLNKYNLLKNKHAKSSSGSRTHIPACTCTHTAHTHTHFVISKRGGRENSISVLASTIIYTKVTLSPETTAVVRELNLNIAHLQRWYLYR